MMTRVCVQFAFSCALFLSLPHSVFAQTVRFSADERRIIKLADERRGVDTIADYLSNKDPRTVRRAAIALANIGDTAVRPKLLLRLREVGRPDHAEAEAAVVWAVGTMGPDSTSWRGIKEYLKRSKSIQAFEAYGRVVPSAVLSQIATELLPYARSSEPELALGASEAILQVALRKQMTAGLLELLDPLAENDNPEVRWRVAYAFARTEDSSLLDPHFATLKSLLLDVGSKESRMFAATALGRLHSSVAINELMKAAKSEKDWQVQTNIYTALQRSPAFSRPLFEILKAPIIASNKENPSGDHAALAAFSTIEALIRAGKLSGPDSIEMRDWLEMITPDREQYPFMSVRVRSSLLGPLARIGSPWLFIATNDFASHRDYVALSKLLPAMALRGDTTEFKSVLEALPTSPDNQILVLGSLDTFWSRAKADPSFRRRLEETKLANAYRYAIIRIADLVDDPGVVSVALGQMTDSTILKDKVFAADAETHVLRYLDKFRSARHRDQIQASMVAYRWLHSQGLIADEAAGRAALGKVFLFANEIGDRQTYDTAMTLVGPLKFSNVPAFKPKASAIDWKYLEESPDTLLVTSDFGQMTFKLFKDDAPLTCLSMLKLASIYFFANNVVHRVVPNFVVQAGDPLRTGWGGPDFSIRREIAPVKYDHAGVIGMASNGKDTEGSQWFITHLPTPHLDSRYTIFGEVTGGKELIDRYQIGDVIQNIIPFRP